MANEGNIQAPAMIPQGQYMPFAFLTNRDVAIKSMTDMMLQNPLHLKRRPRKCQIPYLAVQARQDSVHDTGAMAGEEDGGLHATSW